MLRFIKKEACSGCGACTAICPHNAITMGPDEEGFRYPTIDHTICVGCDLCKKACPVLSAQKAESTQQSVLASISRDENVRYESSSGGVFSVLADCVLAQGGVVFGAAFTDEFEINHIYVEDPRQLYRLRGSKYVQSDTKDTYRQAKDFLTAGRPVLYTGTPCQIAGLRSFLRKDYDKLICLDVVCHGAPSPSVWQRYLRYRQEQAGSPVKKISFRNKALGWDNFCVRFDFEDGAVYKMPFQKDPYMNAFLANLCLRPSCYDCSFKGWQRPSDITLADFWGVHDLMPEMYDNKGTSLVFLNTPKGHALFDAVSQYLMNCPVDGKSAITWNSAAVSSVKKPKQRELFMQKISHMDFCVAVKQCIPAVPLHKRVIQKVKGILKKILKRK